MCLTSGERAQTPTHDRKNKWTQDGHMHRTIILQIFKKRTHRKSTTISVRYVYICIRKQKYEAQKHSKTNTKNPHMKGGNVISTMPTMETMHRLLCCSLYQPKNAFRDNSGIH